jgi:hypothetical protein
VHRKDKSDTKKALNNCLKEAGNLSRSLSVSQRVFLKLGFEGRVKERKIF